MEKKKILITGAGAPGGPGIIKALQKDAFELFTCDCDPLASGRFLNHSFIQVPNANDESFISFILDYCLNNRIEVIFPLVTKELFKFSAAKDLFLKNNIKVIVSAYESLSIANDKGKIYRHLLKNGVDVPRFEIVNTVEALVAASANLGYPGVPVCIKPTVSNGSRGVRILQEKTPEYELLFNHKPDHLYTSLNRICEILNGRQFPELLVAEYLPGPEFTVDTIVTDGIPRLIIPRERTQIRAGISVRGRFVKHERIIDYCDKILRSLHLHGPIGLQVKESKHGDFQLLEINPRIQGTSVAALGVGINLPAIAVEQEFEQIEIDTSNINWGTSFVRYYEELFY